jgi:hypothetical protein
MGDPTPLAADCALSFISCHLRMSRRQPREAHSMPPWRSTPRRSVQRRFSSRTGPSISHTLNIFARREAGDTKAVASLAGNTLATYTGYSWNARYPELLPDTRIVAAPDKEGMLRMVATGEASCRHQRDRVRQGPVAPAFSLQAAHLIVLTTPDDEESFSRETMVVVFRIVYLCAALFAGTAGTLVTASLFMADRAPQSGRFLVISIAVSAVFLTVGALQSMIISSR